MSQGDPNYPSSYENPAVVPSPRPDTVPPVSTRTPSTQATTPAANRGGGGGGNSADSLIDNVKNYVLSIYGALKIVQFILCIFGIIFAGSSDTDVAARGFFIFICVLFMVLTFVLFTLYAIRLHHQFEMIPWTLLEVVFNGVAIFLFLLSAIILAAKCGGDGLLVVAVIVGFICMVFYGGTGVLAFLEFRSGGDPAGEVAQ
ncbi:plasmolipin-like [Symsagittifera roscoffensis]|uniref:plasmolipin-like n=1 Tax=Symsagittifera roscoffensis TaxID=84072 RepID=UPI00307C1A4A